jgi:hypothetical protein
MSSDRVNSTATTLDTKILNASTFGKNLGIFFGGVILCSTLFISPFLLVPYLPRRFFGALPYYPTSIRRIKAVFNKIPSRFMQKDAGFIDLGSGDGVAVLEAARRGLNARGVELNPTLVLMSRFAAWRNRRSIEKAGGTALFITGNLFDFNFQVFNNTKPLTIMIFGVVPIMSKIGKKIVTEGPRDIVILSHKFVIPIETGLKEIDIIDDIRIYTRIENSKDFKNELLQ